MHLQRPHRDHDDRSLRLQARHAALDVEELLGAQVRAEARFRHHQVCKRETHAGRGDRVAPVRDVAEGPPVHERRSPLQRLHEVRVQRVLEEQRHGALRLQITGAHRFLVGGEPHDDPAESGLQILEPGGQGQDRHHFGARDDDVPLLARRPGVQPPQPDDDVAQGAVVHVDGARPDDAAHVQAQRIAVVQVRIEHRRQQVMRARDRMEVAGEMEVDVLHRHHLRVPPARRAALNAEHRPEARLPDTEDRVLAEALQGLRQPHRHRRLALSRRRGVDAGDEDETPLRRAALQHGQPDLRLVLPVQLEIVVGQAQIGGNVGDGAQFRTLRDLDVGRDLEGAGHVTGCSSSADERRAPNAR